jgi:hypothetical protein
MNNKGFVVVTDYIEANTGLDVSDALQQIINDNPHKTIYFPDGEYLLAKPICTPADPRIAVSLELSCFAIIKAADGWDSPEALVRMGGIYPYNSISIPGSNYHFKGGIIDGNGVANGISVDSGRETLISHVSIKNTQIGIHIKRGANNGSSDSDIEMVNVVGNNKENSIGVFIEGYDNTVRNMRIASVQTGILMKGAGNSLRDIHPLFIYGGTIDQSKSVAFDDQSWGNNWYSYCYSDEMATGFRFKGSATPVFQHCFGMWYSTNGKKYVGFECEEGSFAASICNANIALRGDVTNRAFIKVALPGGRGIIENPMFVPENCDDDTYKDYLVGHVIHRI